MHHIIPHRILAELGQIHLSKLIRELVKIREDLGNILPASEIDRARAIGLAPITRAVLTSTKTIYYIVLKMHTYQSAKSAETEELCFVLMLLCPFVYPFLIMFSCLYEQLEGSVSFHFTTDNRPK